LFLNLREKFNKDN